MIEARSLTRKYGKTTAVQSVSFRIDAGEVVGLLGQNGAGKTTTMRMLSGYLEPTAGAIFVDGKKIHTGSTAFRQSLGYLPESLPLYPELLVADYLDYIATLKGIGRADRRQAMRDAVLATELQPQALQPISALSRGYRQRLAVAQALLGQPRLLILDEPTNGLDPRQAAHMRDLIRRLARRATVILSTHIMQEVEAVCDRVLILHRGQLEVDQTLADLKQSNRLLLRTDSSVKELGNYLRRMPQVTAIEQTEDGDGRQYLLTVADAADLDTAAANISRCTLEAGARLKQLQPVGRDLASLFCEVNSSDD